MCCQRCLRCHEELDRGFCELFLVRNGVDEAPKCKMQKEALRMRDIGWSPAIISAVLGIDVKVILLWIS
ncbi:MAG: hypothetical protein CMA77_00200 [Euryarchaeota archaeon]|nr:hypothetical protein [Euryarchaeota archaeon]